MVEKSCIYKFKSHVNASHAMRWEGGMGAKHNHTWEIICEIKSQDDEMHLFEEIEGVLKDFFQPFSGSFLNEMPPFLEINPSVENVTNYFYDQLSLRLAAIQTELIRIEVGESPTRFYCIEKHA